MVSHNQDKEYFLKYRKNNKEKFLEYNRKMRRNLLDQFLKMYGNKCACCGEFEREFLVLDHVKGQIGIERESYNTAFRNAIKQFDPEKYRVLCHNCNMATRWGRTCPHQRK
jgi:hypothetical protein